MSSEMGDRPTKTRRTFDLIAYDQQDLPILLVEVKRAGDVRTIDRLAQDTGNYVQSSARHAPFFLIAQPQELRLYQHAPPHDWQLAYTFNSRDILTHYDTSYGSNPVTEQYLASLVEAWLSDIAFHWSKKSPPAEDVFEKLDLVNALRRGSTVTDARL
jgi:hypothetical protein